MKQSQTPFLVTLAIVLGLFILLNELSRKRDADSSAPPAQEREYDNPYLGFSLRLPEGWTMDESVGAQRQRLQSTLDIVHLSTGAGVTLRATEQPWEYFEPLAHRPPGSGRVITVNGREGQVSPVGTRGVFYTTVVVSGLLVELLGSQQAVDTVISSLHWLPEEAIRQAAVAFSRTPSLPAKVRQWQQDCRSLDITSFGSILHESGKTYVYVGGGKKPTGGYECSISRIVRTGSDDITVFVVFTRPDLGQIVSQAYSLPSDIVRIEEPGLSARFFGDGNDAPPQISILEDHGTLQRIYDQSRTIKVFYPSPNSEIGQHLAYSGIVHGSVERLFSRILNAQDEVLDRNSIPVQISPHWISFVDTLSVPDLVRSGDMLHLELYTIDDPSGDIVDQIRIPLRAKGSE